ncbi:unnamed protein product [Mesocestoides corti]|nr:unnamed protein product [Mesocestoides corti]
MTRENRPFGLNDIVAALQKSHGKAAVSKAVDELVLENSLVEKVNGKQRVFVVPQDKLPQPDSDELKDLDNEIINLSNDLQKLKEQVRTAESDLKVVQSSLSLEEAIERNAIVESKIEEIRKSIAAYGSGVKITPEEFTKAHEKQKAAVSEWRKRKRLAMDIVDAIAEGYPKSRKQLMEDIGIETDEDRELSLASFV